MKELLDFIKLRDHEQFANLSKSGVFLMNRETNSHLYSLYAYQNFFVEVFYSHNDPHCLYLKVFKDSKLLDSYLETIDVELRFK